MHLLHVFTPEEFDVELFIAVVLVVGVVVDVGGEELVVVGKFASSAIFLLAIGTGVVAGVGNQEQAEDVLIGFDVDELLLELLFS